jgi:hypothetical protein
VAHDHPTLTFNGHEVPAGWLVGEFELEVAELTDGKFDEAAGLLRGVAGKAWLRLPCARPPIHAIDRLDRPDVSLLKHAVEVVREVTHPQTEVSLAEALEHRPDAAIGDTIHLDVDVARIDLQDLVRTGRGVRDWIDTNPKAARFAVDLIDVTVSFEESRRGIARIVDGVVRYPVQVPFPRPIEIVIDGFVLVLSTIELTPHGSTAVAEVRLPGGIADIDSCLPATIDLGLVPMSARCDFYLDAPNQDYGPWLLGDTGMVIEGTGFVLDLSTTASPPPRPAAWRGLVLRAGKASGEKFVPEPCNTGYLRGHYTYTDALVVSTGFYGTLELADPVSFTALNPLGQRLTFQSGWIDVHQTAVAAGELRDGSIELPTDAACVSAPGDQVKIGLDVVSIQPGLDLAGVFDYGGAEISWGELTRHGEEVVAWSAVCETGYLFLPAGPYESFCPVASGSFAGPAINSVPDASLAQLDAFHAAGVTFPSLTSALVFSPDRPHGRANPLQLNRLQGWVRVGVTGIDGELSTFVQSRPEEFGDPASIGYVGKRPFKATLFANDKRNLLAEFVTSAAFDSHFGGRFRIPPPCNIADLEVEEIKLTSTACFVGGDVVLPPAGVQLDHWDLALVPTGPPNQSAVMSIRTGRILLTAAGIAEPKHFDEPFGLTWGEMLADGNIGQLFLDFNNWGQRFDGLVFNPHELALSDAAVPGDPYLGVSGGVCFPFFGVHPINVRDASTAASPDPRNVTVPKVPITPHAGATDLALSGTWHDVNSGDLAVFECLDVDVDYNVAAQYGFLGWGTAELGFLHSDPLTIDVEISSGATDIHISATDTHDLDVGLFARLGGIAQIAGCLRIEGPVPTRMAIFGVLEQSAAAGAILGPKAGFEVEVNLTVTPTSLNFYASGDMLVSLALVEVEASATAHLLVDFAMGVAEGELYGRIDCDAVVAGLSGEGQLTWHLSNTMQYLQGRVKVGVVSVIVSGGLEGGFFLGNNVPNQLAWVLDTTDPHFRMSRSILPATLTGVYGYGRASVGFNAYILGGGVDVFAGAGAFVGPLGPGAPVAGFAAGLLPIVVGACGIYVHGEILSGLVSASAWANLSLRGPIPTFFEGTFGLEGCVAWVLCASVSVTATIDATGLHLTA